jgi:hypothetical protein
MERGNLHAFNKERILEFEPELPVENVLKIVIFGFTGRK